MPVYGFKYVLTSPDKVFHNVDAVIKLLDKKFDCFFTVKEYGENSDNPHFNVAIQGGGQSFKNMTRDLKKAYYGKKLEDFEKIEGFRKHGVHSSGIPNYEGWRNFANYLKKEIVRIDDLVYGQDLIYQKAVDIFELTKDMEPYDKEKCEALKQARKEERQSKANIVKILVDIHNDYNLGKPTTFTFRRCCAILADRNNREGSEPVPLKPLLNRVGIHYVLYSNALGDFESMSKFIANALKDFEPVPETE